MYLFFKESALLFPTKNEDPIPFVHLCFYELVFVRGAQWGTLQGSAAVP